MNSTVIKRSLRLSRLSPAVLFALALLTIGFSYLWLVPLFRPRGDFLWGYYRLKDILLGIPVGLTTLCAVVLLLTPGKYWLPVALRITTLSASALVLLFTCDVVYAFFVQGAWRPNFWLDQAHIARRYAAADPELGFVRRPLTSWRGYLPDLGRIVDYDTDENGFRNPVGQHTADIVFIGDSFTEAAQVSLDQTFVRQVGTASGLTVVNLGRGAYGPQQELIVLQRYGLSYTPRFVVWQLFEGNDLTDAAIFAKWQENPTQQAISLKDRYFQSSLLVEWLTKTRSVDSSIPLVTLFNRDGRSYRVRLRYAYDAEQPAKVPDGFAETTRSIEAGFRLCQAQGIELVIVLVPTMAHVLQPYISFDRSEDQAHYFPNGFGNDKHDFASRTAEFCNRIGCSFIDASKALQKAAATDIRNLYIPNDEHLDIAGHTVIAQVVLEWLRSNKALMPKTARSTVHIEDQLSIQLFDLIMRRQVALQLP